VALLQILWKGMVKGLKLEAVFLCLFGLFFLLLLGGLVFLCISVWYTLASISLVGLRISRWLIILSTFLLYRCLIFTSLKIGCPFIVLFCLYVDLYCCLGSALCFILWRLLLHCRFFRFFCQLLINSYQGSFLVISFLRNTLGCSRLGCKSLCFGLLFLSFLLLAFFTFVFLYLFRASIFIIRVFKLTAVVIILTVFADVTELIIFVVWPVYEPHVLF